jgi:FG-GAP-like repeat
MKRSLCYSTLFVLTVIATGFGQPTWTTHVISSSSNNPTSIHSVDMDLDGDLDLLISKDTLVGCEWWENVNGNFYPHVIDNFQPFRCLDAGDINQDGDIDVVGGTGYFDEVVIYENEDNEFIEHTIELPVNGVSYLIARDLDMDNDLDIIGCEAYTSGIFWVENSGAEFVFHAMPLAGSSKRRCEVGDMDNDGDLDIVASVFSGGGQILIWNNLGEGLDWSVTTAVSDYSDPWDITLVDINQDGILDILTCSYSSGSVEWFENTGNGFDQHHLVDLNGVRGLSVADINGNGHSDLAMVSSLDGIYWWDGTGEFETPLLVEESIGGFYVIADDLDGDGDIDLAAVDYTTNGIKWFEQNGSPHSVSYSNTPMNPPYIFPPSGGTITYSVALRNTTAASYMAEHQTWAELPNGNTYGPLSSITFNVVPFMEYSVSNLSVQMPPFAPAGSYRFVGRLILPDYTLEDSFPMFKQAATDQDR